MQTKARNRWKRVGLSFACAVAADVFMSAGLCVVQYGSQAKFEGFVLFAFIELLFVIPCWLLAMPLIALFDHLDGWRLWVLATFGILIGPIVILLWVIFSLQEKLGSFDSASMLFLWAAAGVSFLTTILYITILKLSTRIQQPTP